MPKRAGAEVKAEADQAWELIYKCRSYSKREQSPETLARTPGTPLFGHSLTQSSLLQWLWEWTQIWQQILVSMSVEQLV